MFSRFAFALAPGTAKRIFETTGPLPDIVPSWSIAPDQKAIVVRRHQQRGERRLDLHAWGLVPHWSQHSENPRKPANARAETVASTPIFREAFARRRCLVPANAFYQWQTREGAPRQPYAISRADDQPLALAGIWEEWRSLGGYIVRSFAIIVTEANAEMAPIHNRMPAIVEPADWPAWLGEVERDATELLGPAAPGVLRLWPVSTRVNRLANNDAQLLEPIEALGGNA